MSKAKEAALKAYPFLPTNVNNGVWDDNKEERIIYQQGYERAEKDTIERAKRWIIRQRGFSKTAILDFEKFMEEEQ